MEKSYDTLFFFQAEDGIRDPLVTGVQTCALPISAIAPPGRSSAAYEHRLRQPRDRKSTRLNSSHEWISYAVFCLKKKKKHAKEHVHREKYKIEHRTQS